MFVHSTSSQKQEKTERAKYLLWDCESSLYDSVELKSFQRHLNSAIFSGRSLSMPHFINRHSTNVAAVSLPSTLSKKCSTSKILSQRLQKLIRSIFRSKSNNNNNMISSLYCDGGSLFDVNYQRFGALTTIPETPENCNICVGGDDHKLFVGRSASHRFTDTVAGISCA